MDANEFLNLLGGFGDVIRYVGGMDMPKDNPVRQIGDRIQQGAANANIAMENALTAGGRAIDQGVYHAVNALEGSPLSAEEIDAEVAARNPYRPYVSFDEVQAGNVSPWDVAGGTVAVAPIAARGVQAVKAIAPAARRAGTAIVDAFSGTARPYGQGLLTHVDEAGTLSGVPAVDAALTGEYIPSTLRRAGASLYDTVPVGSAPSKVASIGYPTSWRDADLLNEAIKRGDELVAAEQAALRARGFDIAPLLSNPGTASARPSIVRGALAGNAVAQGGDAMNEAAQARAQEAGDMAVADEVAAAISGTVPSVPSGASPTIPSSAPAEGGLTVPSLPDPGSTPDSVSGAANAIALDPEAYNPTPEEFTYLPRMSLMSDEQISQVINSISGNPKLSTEVWQIVRRNAQQIDDLIERSRKNAEEITQLVKSEGEEAGGSFWSMLGWLITIPFAIRRGISPDEVWTNIVNARVQANPRIMELRKRREEEDNEFSRIYGLYNSNNNLLRALYGSEATNPELMDARIASYLANAEAARARAGAASAGAERQRAATGWLNQALGTTNGGSSTGSATGQSAVDHLNSLRGSGSGSGSKYLGK